MKNFKIPKAPGKYPNTNAFLNAVYKANKSVIDTAFDNEAGGPKKTFKNTVKEYLTDKKHPLNVKDALKTIARSTRFTSEVERFKENAWQGIVSDKFVYKRFRELTKEKGRYTKFDPDKLVWSKADKGYIYNDKFLIKFGGYPNDVKIIEK